MAKIEDKRDLFGLNFIQTEGNIKIGGYHKNARNSYVMIKRLANIKIKPYGLKPFEKFIGPQVEKRTSNF